MFQLFAWFHLCAGGGGGRGIAGQKTLTSCYLEEAADNIAVFMFGHTQIILLSMAPGFCRNEGNWALNLTVL
jgi:hypothetical protein